MLVEWLENGDFERMWKWSWPNFMYYPNISLVSVTFSSLVNSVLVKRMVRGYALYSREVIWLNLQFCCSKLNWAPSHHDMGCPQVLDGGNGLQILWVPVNIISKQLQTANKGWYSSIGVEQKANKYFKKSACYKMLFHTIEKMKGINHQALIKF
jgi:hypothetical protein